jgi:hypothetical protein
MRIVRSNGDRYTIPLYDLPGISGERIAVLGLPRTFPETLIELIDADGATLASYGIDGITRDAKGNPLP